MNKPQKIVDFHLGRLVAHLGHRLVEERRQVVFVEKVGMWLWCVEIEPIFPHIFVWGSCFWFCIPPRLRPAFAPPPAPPSLSHTPSFHTQLCHKSSFTHTHNFVTHHLSHTTLSRTIFHTQLCHTPSFHTQLCHTPSVTHNFVTHTIFPHTTLSHTIFPHTTLSHTIFHTQLCHTPSFTHNFVTHHLSTHNFVTHHLSHTTLSHTPSFHTHNFVTHHLSTHNFVTHHLSHTTLSHTIFHTQLCHTPSFTHNFVTHYRFAWHIYRRFAWQTWHLARGRRVTYGTGLALVARLGPLGRWRCGSLRGRRGTWRHLPSFCLAGVALGDIDLGERGTYGTGLALVARLGPLGRAVTPRHFAWQGWHLATCTVVLPGRRGTWRHLPAFSDTNLLHTTLLDTTNSHATYDVPFVWQGWHLATSTPTWGSFLDRPYIYIYPIYFIDI